MKEKIPFRNGDEVDLFTKWRHYLNWRPGVRKKIKRGYNKRLRKTINKEANNEIYT